MQYPKKQSAVNTVNIGLRVDEELRDDFKEIRQVADEDVSEAMRIKLRELRDELRNKYGLDNAS